MGKKDPRLLEAMVRPTEYKDDPKLVCEAIVTFYERATALPEERAGEVLRLVVSKL
jgi:hypothetical protein